MKETDHLGNIIVDGMIIFFFLGPVRLRSVCTTALGLLYKRIILSRIFSNWVVGVWTG